MELDLLVQFVMYMLAKLETIKFKTAFLSPPVQLMKPAIHRNAFQCSGYASTKDPYT